MSEIKRFTNNILIWVQYMVDVSYGLLLYDNGYRWRRNSAKECKVAECFCYDGSNGELFGSYLSLPFLQ